MSKIQKIDEYHPYARALINLGQVIVKRVIDGKNTDLELQETFDYVMSSLEQILIEGSAEGIL